MIKNLVIAARLWMRNGRGPELQSRNYVPGLMQLKLAAAEREAV